MDFFNGTLKYTVSLLLRLNDYLDFFTALFGQGQI